MNKDPFKEPFKKQNRLILPKVRNPSVKEDFKVLDQETNLAGTVSKLADNKSQRADETNQFPTKLNFVNRKIQGGKE